MRCDDRIMIVRLHNISYRTLRFQQYQQVSTMRRYLPTTMMHDAAQASTWTGQNKVAAQRLGDAGRGGCRPARAQESTRAHDGPGTKMRGGGGTGTWDSYLGQYSIYPSLTQPILRWPQCFSDY